MRASSRVPRQSSTAVDPPKKLTALEILNQSQLIEETKAAAAVASSSAPQSGSWTKPILTPPAGSRFVIGEEACLSVKVITANKLRSKDGKAEPYVRLRHAEFAWNSKSTSSSDAPQFNENITFPVVRPTVNLLLLEVFERDKVGGKQLLGYVAFDLSLLPKEMPVVTTEQLSGSDSGEITVCLKAVDFGLENTGDDYLIQYLSWRKYLVPVNRRPSKARRASISAIPTATATPATPAAAPALRASSSSSSSFTKRGGTIPTFDDEKTLSASTPAAFIKMPKGLAGGRRQSIASSSVLPVSSGEKLEKKMMKGKNRTPGPYGGRSVPGAYSIENGYVKKNPSPFAKMFGKLSRFTLFKKK